MLGKLFKYEFKNTCKLMLTIYGVTLVLSILGAVTLGFSSTVQDQNLSKIGAYFSAAFVFLYVLTIFALFIITYVYMCVHFYKTMYSSQGYLTHTLPVNPVTTFHVKLAVSFIWMISALLVCGISMLILAGSASHGQFFIQLKYALSNEPPADVGYSWGALFFTLLFIAVISCLNYILMVYACASIGQLFSQNKIVYSIVAGIVIYFAQQIVSLIVLLIAGSSMLTAGDTVALSFVDTMFSPFGLASWGLSLVFIAIFYAINVVIVRKHINLD